jgi:hypothetical protein
MPQTLKVISSEKVYCYSNIMNNFWIQLWAIQSYNINVTLSSRALQKYWQDVLEEFTKFIVTGLAVSVKLTRTLTTAGLSNQNGDGRGLRDMRKAYRTSFARVETLIAAMKTHVFWVFMPCILVNNPRRFEGTTILRSLSLSKWGYLNLKHFGCKTRRYKNHLEYSGVDCMCVCIHIYIYTRIYMNSYTELSYILRRWALNPLSVKENPQSCYMLHFFSVWRKVFGQKAFDAGTTSNSARSSVNWFEFQARPTTPGSILVVWFVLYISWVYYSNI